MDILLAITGWQASYYRPWAFFVAIGYHLTFSPDPQPYCTIVVPIHSLAAIQAYTFA
jgi:hypothetical protein